MINETICPETLLRVILPAEEIPDQAEVTKVTGEEVYVLRHGLTLYSDTKGEKPVQVDGFFLVGSRGSINSIKPDKKLCWVVTAEELMDTLRCSWETDA